MHCAPSTAQNIVTSKMAGVLPASVKRAVFAELKLLSAIIMQQIGLQLPGLLPKNKKMKKRWVGGGGGAGGGGEWGPEVCSGLSIHGCRVVQLNVLAEALDGGCEAWGQFYVSPALLKRQYLDYDCHCTHVVQTPSVERLIFVKQIRPTVTPEPC